MNCIKTRILLFAFLCAGACLFINCSTAIAAEQPDIQQILKKLDEVVQRNNDLAKQNQDLAQKVQKLEKQVTSGAAAPGMLRTDEISVLKERVTTLEQQGPAKENAEIASLKEDMGELTSVMQNVERKSLMDRVQIGVELRTRCDWFNFNDQVAKKNAFGRVIGYKHKNDAVNAFFSNRFRLNLKTDITDNVKFTGRLVMYKNWNGAGGISERSSNEGRVPGDDADLSVERAYVDYFFAPTPKLPMALTFGRLPVSDGLPSDLREDTPRKSVYPALAYDWVGDGIGLSLMLDQLTGLQDSALRFLYFKSSTFSNAKLYLNDDLGIDDTNVYVGQFETMLPGKAFKDILFMANYTYIPKIPSKDLRSSGFVVDDVPGSFGDMWKLTFLLEAKKFLGSNFDWFASFGYSSSDGKDGMHYKYYGLIPYDVGLVRAGKGDKDGAGTCIYLGTRYTIPWAALNNPKLGIEFNRGSKYWVVTSDGAEDPLHKLSTRGNCWDFYYIQPINNILSARLGYTWLRNEWPGQGSAETARYRQTIKNAYMLLDARF